MDKILKTILIISIAVFGVGILFLPSTNAQVDELVVEYWTGAEWKSLKGPVFSETNFLPGNSVTRLVRVTNNSVQSQRIATRALNVNDPDNLGDVLNLEVKEGATIRYSNTLSNFFDGGEAYLSDLATGNNTQYDFTISFNSSAGNPFQGKSLGFDILIGFQGAAGGMPPGWGTGVTGPLPPGLTIKYEKDIYLATTSATITWDTSYESTSQVIFDTLPGKFKLNPADGGGPPNYGYAFSKEGDDIFGSGKGMSHRVTIIGLSPSTTYYYRAVSHASLAISQEHSFTTLGIKVEEKVEEGIEEEIVLPEEVAPGGEEAFVTPEGAIEKPLVSEGAAPAEGGIVTVPPEERVPGGGLASLLLASLGTIRETAWMMILATFCLVGLIIIGIREWELARKKKKNIS